MKKFLLCYSKAFYFIMLTVCVTMYASAQNLPLSEFVIYAGSDTNVTALKEQVIVTNFGVEIKGNSKVLSGKVGSTSYIFTAGPVSIYDNLVAAGTINLGWNNTIKGNISAGNKVPLNNKNVFIADRSFSLKGNLDVAGNIFINKAQSIIDGKVTHPQSTSYKGPVPSLGEVTAQPAIPTLPAKPAISNFNPAGNQSITNTQTIDPGAYAKVKLHGNKTITFSKPGTYTFSSINNTGNLNKFVFDFNNTADGVFIIQVYGDVDLGEFKSILKNGGSASRIYLETHGNGSSCILGKYAFTMNNCILENSVWQGTVYAPYAGINIGSLVGASTVQGALWSGTRVNINNAVQLSLAAFQSCIPPDVNAGDDKVISCTAGSTIVLSGSSLTPGAQFNWQAIDTGFIVSGANTPFPKISKGGSYVLTVTATTGCTATDTVVITTSCIVPYYPAPDSGKTQDIIGSELNALYDNFGTVQDTAQNIFTILNDSVIIEVIAFEGKYNELLSLLQTPEYGLTDLINNGSNTLIITGKYPVKNLLKLDSLTNLINYCRPAFPPVSNAGIVTSAGDTALYANLARNGFKLSGQGIKIGVISNSYNTIPCNPAQTDILNGDLPGLQNPDNNSPVEVLRDYPYGRASDEGRAMLQIVHDVAPKAKLAFRTGFITAGDFAQGIETLKNDTCNIIVDDVTYITEPFFKDGIVAKAVDNVAQNGVSYFTAAGNYGNKSYSNTFKPVTAPPGMNGLAHDFGNGDIYQSLSVPAGNYTLVLQWDDSIYSLNPASGGAKNDLDFYLTDNSGNILFGFNRNNIGGDPIEVMPFTVTSNSQANIMVIKNAGPDNNIHFKYIIFRGEAVINEYNNGTSTIVGQANADGAMSVGAVLYSNTPAYGVNPPTIASFSSIGGTPVNGVIRNKPDFTGPNGVNTTVYLGGVNIDGDLFPNFFGTSAAAPHVAAVAALVMEAREKFYNEQLSPQQVRSLLQTNATDMDAPGFDYVSGYGFVQADSVIRTFAAPTPSITNLILPDSTTVPGSQPFMLTVKGNYLSSSSTILFRGNALPTTFISNTSVSATIPTFSGNPAIQVYTQPITSNKNDGGYSDSLFFFSPVKKNVIVTADNKVKKYGEKIPAFSVNILIDSIPIDSTDYTLKDLGLDSIFYTTPATSLSNTGIYYIRPAIAPTDSTDSVDIALTEQYNYTFNDGLLSINKLPLTITPNDTALIYGDKIGAFNYKYTYPDSLIADADKAVFLDSLKTSYTRDIASEIALADARAIVNGRALTDEDLQNLGFIASARAIVNARPIVNARAIVNLSPQIADTTFVVDLAVKSIFNYQVDSASAVLVNARPIVNARAIVNARPIVNGTATVNARPIVNGSPIVNGNSIGDSTQSDVAVIIDEDDVNAPENDTLSVFKPITLITGTTTGKFAIVPAANLTENFDVSYGLGSLDIAPHSLTIKANDTSIVYGNKTTFTSTISGYQYNDNDSIIATLPTYIIVDAYNKPVTDSIIPAGTYSIVPSNITFIGDTINYIPEYIIGTLVVKPASLIVKADDKYIYPIETLPKFTSTITGFIGNDAATVISGPKYKLSPDYNCFKPGLYSITPSALVLSTPGNYTITYVSGNLCVNPYRITSKQIKVNVECISNYTGTEGYKYRIRFSYKNNNETPVFIPIGKDNDLKTEGSYAGEQPELFMPGTGYFELFANTLPVTWTVKSYQCLLKQTDKAVACSTSPSCGSSVIAGNIAAAKATTFNTSTDTEFKVYPNPVIDKVTIEVTNGTIDYKQLNLFDISGKKYQPKIASGTNSSVTLDVSRMNKGVYLISIKVNDKFKVFKILKQ